MLTFLKLCELEGQPDGAGMAGWTPAQFQNRMITVFGTRLRNIKKIFSPPFSRVKWAPFSKAGPQFWFLQNFFATVSYYVYDAKIRGDTSRARKEMFERFNNTAGWSALDVFTLALVPQPRAAGDAAEPPDIDFDMATESTAITVASMDGIDFTPPSFIAAMQGSNKVV